VRAVLSLGCGLCARPYRLRAPNGVRVVEVDLPATIEWKARRLDGIDAPEGVSVSRHAADLSCPEQLEAPLASFDGAADGAAGEELVVVLEGVVQYLEASALRALFSRLARRPAPTTIVCDVGGGAWSRIFARRIPAAVSKTGATYVTRIDDPRAFFAPLGFDVRFDVSLAEWDARRPSPRWRTPWTARLVPGFRRAARVVELVSRH
jgi:methyltransferase (TIGR00027 family)